MCVNGDGACGITDPTIAIVLTACTAIAYCSNVVVYFSGYACCYFFLKTGFLQGFRIYQNRTLGFLVF
jgi:hypothetical protein